MNRLGNTIPYGLSVLAYFGRMLHQVFGTVLQLVTVSSKVLDGSVVVAANFVASFLPASWGQKQCRHRTHTDACQYQRNVRPEAMRSAHSFTSDESLTKSRNRVAVFGKMLPVK